MRDARDARNMDSTITCFITACICNNLIITATVVRTFTESVIISDFLINFAFIFLPYHRYTLRRSEWLLQYDPNICCLLHPLAPFLQMFFTFLSQNLSGTP